MENPDKFDSLLKEMRSVALSIPCPYCGGVQQELVKQGEEAKCIYCRRYYTIKDSTSGISGQAIKNLVDDVLAKHNLAVEKTSKDLMERYTQRVFDEIKSYYTAFERMPPREELDEKLSTFTASIQRDFQVIIEGQKRIEQKQDVLLEHDVEQDAALKRIEQALKELQVPTGMVTETNPVQDKLVSRGLAQTRPGLQVSEEQNLQIKQLENVLQTTNSAYIVDQYGQTILTLGNYHLMMGQLELAAQRYNEVVQNSRNKMLVATALNNLGLVYNNMGNLQASIKYYQDAIQTDPSYAMPYYNIGVAYQLMMNLPEAIRYYQKAIERDPAMAVALYNMGLAWTAIGNLQNALQCFDRAVRINPNFAFAWYNLGVVYMNMGNWPTAYNCFRYAVNLNPMLRQALMNLGIYNI